MVLASPASIRSHCDSKGDAMVDRAEQIIAASRRSFNSELLSDDYPPIHDDADHVDRLLTMLDPQPGGTYLDLATGNGIVAFAIADRQPEANVLGVDIADQAIANNRSLVGDQKRRTVEFLLTDGVMMDFNTDTFDGIVSRYALHHFPALETTLAECGRVLRPGGSFVVADATRSHKDGDDFLNRFQALKPDGHVRMHTAEALVDVFRNSGFEPGSRFSSKISFTRDLDSSYHALLEATPRQVLGLYGLTTTDEHAAITIDVLNARFDMALD